jgi:Ca2+-binding EF-hand superfamily protein
MPVAALFLPILAFAAQAPAAEVNPIVITGRSGPPFISPMGEPFRALAPGEDTLADWFRQADRNHDGMLTADEMKADADRFFAKLDTDHNGQIDPEELIQYEWEVAPEIQVNMKFRRARAASGGLPTNGQHDRGGGPRRPGGVGENGSRDSADGGLDGGLQGGARYALLNIPEPVSAADANLDRAISLSEFRQAAAERFQLLDKNHQGKLSLQELETMRPPDPLPGRHSKHREDSADTRYGVPLPPGE